MSFLEDNFSWGDFDTDTYKQELRCNECDWITTGNPDNCENAAYDHIDSGHGNRAKVVLFKPNGKYYTEEYWTIPENAIGPHDMIKSPDFRRIGNGSVLVETQEPWGFPCLFPNERSYNNE